MKDELIVDAYVYGDAGELSLDQPEYIDFDNIVGLDGTSGCLYHNQYMLAIDRLSPDQLDFIRRYRAAQVRLHSDLEAMSRLPNGASASDEVKELERWRTMLKTVEDVIIKRVTERMKLPEI